MARSYMELQSRAAFGAGQGLGVEAAIRRGFVFGTAVVAEREIGHRGVGPVVGHGGDDGVARAALGAIDEGIAVTPFMGIVQLFHAVVTGIKIRWYVDFGLAAVVAWKNLESRYRFQFGRFRQGKLRSR